MSQAVGHQILAIPVAQAKGGTGATSLGAGTFTPAGGALGTLADHVAAKLDRVGGDASATLVTPTAHVTSRFLADIAAEQRDGQIQARYTSRTFVADFAYGAYTQRANCTGPSITQDTAKEARKLTWVSATSGQYVALRLSGTWDLSAATDFLLELGFDAPGAALTGVGYIFSSDTNFTSFQNFAVGSGQSGVPHLQQTARRIPKAGLSVTGTVNWSAIKHIEIKMLRSGETNAVDVMYVKKLWANVVAKPRILLTFDGSIASFHTGIVPTMAARDLRGTLYTWQGGAHTTQQLRDLYALGWDIGSHTWSHPYLGGGLTDFTRSGTVATVTFAEDHGYTAGVDSVVIAGFDQPEFNGTFLVQSTPTTKSITITVAGVEPRTSATGWGYRAADPIMVASEVRRQRDYVRQLGLPRGADHLCYPSGSWNPSIFAALRELGVKTATVVGASNANSCVIDTTNGVGADAALSLPRFDLGLKTAAQGLAVVDQAITENGCGIFLNHGASATPNATEMLDTEWAAFLDGIVARRDAGSIDVVTCSELVGLVGITP